MRVSSNFVVVIYHMLIEHLFVRNDPVIVKVVGNGQVISLKSKVRLLV